MRVHELSPGQLVAAGGRSRPWLLKVSTVYSDNLVTAEVVYPVPPRTTVGSYTAREVAAWRQPSDELVALYDRAWERPA